MPHNSNQQTALFIAAKDNNLGKVDELLVSGADVNKENNRGETPLYIACKQGHLHIVEKLLAVPGINVNTITHEGETPLLVACNESNTSIVRVLLTVPDIDVNQEFYNEENEENDEEEEYENGATPLIIACENEDTEIVKLLLNVPRINVNKPNDYGITPLYKACVEGNIEIVRMLLAVPGIDVNNYERDDISPLMIACQEGHVKVVDELVKQPGININKKDDDGITALYIACRKNRIAIVKKLLTVPGIDAEKAIESAKQNKFSEDIRTLLLNHNNKIINSIVRAISSNDVNYIKHYMETNTQSSGPELLFTAAAKGKINTVKTLLEMGVNPNITTEDLPPLIVSIDFPAIQKLLLQYGANPDYIVNSNGDTTIFLAIAKNKIPTIMHLMNAGANINHKNKLGITPFHETIHLKMNEISIKMLEKGADPNIPFMKVSWSPLQYVCTSKPVSLPLVKKLLEKGANPNYIGNWKTSPLHIATQNQNAELIELLLEYGADPSIPDENKHTPLYYAGSLKHLFYPFQNEYNTILLEPNAENIMQKKIKDGNMLAMLNYPLFKEPLIIKRNGKATNEWKYLYDKQKNPQTNQTIDLMNVRFKKAVLTTANKTRKNRKTRRGGRNKTRKQI